MRVLEGSCGRQDIPTVRWKRHSVFRIHVPALLLISSSQYLKTSATDLPQPYSLFLHCKKDLPRPKKINSLLNYYRYELPGTAVLKAYRHSIHEFLNLPVSVFIDGIVLCCVRHDIIVCVPIGPLSVSVHSRPSVPTSGRV